MTERKIALSIEEAADYTGIGRNTLRKLVEWKKLPVLKVGRKVLIKTDILEKFMEAEAPGITIISKLLNATVGIHQNAQMKLSPKRSFIMILLSSYNVK